MNHDLLALTIVTHVAEIVGCFDENCGQEESGPCERGCCCKGAILKGFYSPKALGFLLCIEGNNLVEVSMLSLHVRTQWNFCYGSTARS